MLEEEFLLISNNINHHHQINLIGQLIFWKNQTYNIHIFPSSQGIPNNVSLKNNLILLTKEAIQKSDLNTRSVTAFSEKIF